eukprot:5763570-Lingulodinium_polyedra.AAC.1
MAACSCDHLRVADSPSHSSGLLLPGVLAEVPEEGCRGVPGPGSLGPGVGALGALRAVAL